MSKHTPGPWRWGSGWDSLHSTTERSKYMNMQLFGKDDVEIIPIRIDHYEPEWDCDSECGPGPTEADRRLIAAAPELLEALKYARSMSRRDDYVDYSYIDGVISKAETP